jgi:hypothetical protein
VAKNTTQNERNRGQATTGKRLLLWPMAKNLPFNLGIRVYWNLGDAQSAYVNLSPKNGAKFFLYEKNFSTLDWAIRGYYNDFSVCARNRISAYKVHFQVEYM